MVLFNYSTKEITAKIVYYGPGLCGKTTNLQLIHSKMDTKSRGKLLSLATETDRTLFFDFLPVDLGKMGGFHVRFQLYTVPGQVHYNATRRMVLKGVDAVVFVADSQVAMLEHNRESWENLGENLVENGYRIDAIPVVVQLNKRDLPNVAAPDKILEVMGAKEAQHFEAVATTGEGVFETLRAIVKLSVAKLKTEFKGEGAIKEPELESLGPPPAPRTAPQPQPLYNPDTPTMEMLSPDEPSEGGLPGEAAAGPPSGPAEAVEMDTLEMDSDMAAGAPAGGGVSIEDEVDMLDHDLLEEEAAGAAAEPGEGPTAPEDAPAAEAPSVPPGEDGTAALAELRERVGDLGREVEDLREENLRLRESVHRLFQGIGRQIKVLGEMLPGEGGEGDSD